VTKHVFTVVGVLLSTVAVALATRTQTFTSVDLDGRTLRMLVQGSGPTTVVFENGLGPSLEMWGRVQPAVSAFAMTVSYDRDGVGLSTAGAAPRDGQHVAADLRCALRLANLPPPYILVGASLGGPYVRIYAGSFPAEVAGIVLVDPTPDTNQIKDAVSAEARALPGTLTQAKESRMPAGIPLFLIRAEAAPELPFATKSIRASLANRQRAVAAESREHESWIAGIPGARLIVTHDSGHNVPIEQPHLVVAIIRQIVDAVTASRPPLR
jgi:pimeloyl-ACP methyl ester carboxylesterase